MIWVKRAKEEHDAFVSVMRDRGVEVLYAEQLLTDVLAVPEAREWVLDRVLDERHVGRLPRPVAATSGGAAPPPTSWPELLIGGVTKHELSQGEGLTYESSRPDRHAPAAAAQLPLPARPVLLDLRRRHAEPDDEARPPAGDDLHGGDLPLAPAVRRPTAASRSGTAASSRTGAAATIEGGDVMPIGNGGRDDRHGRAHLAPGGRR